MSIFEILNNELETISIDFEAEMIENNNEIENVDVSYYRMRLAEIHGAFCVFASHSTMTEFSEFVVHFESVCNEIGTTPNKISDCFYLYRWD